MMSLTKFSLVVILLLTCAPLASARMLSARQAEPMNYALEPSTDYPNLKSQGQASADAFLAGDYKKFVTFVYPKLVEMVGGAEKMIEMVKGGIRDVESKGFKILSYTVGEPDPPMQIGQGLYAILPTKMRMQTPRGVMVDESFMLSISRDGGENWTFLSGTGATNEAQLRIILPEVVGKLKFPAKKEPTFEPNP